MPAGHHHLGAADIGAAEAVARALQRPDAAFHGYSVPFDLLSHSPMDSPRGLPTRSNADLLDAQSRNSLDVALAVAAAVVCVSFGSMSKQADALFDGLDCVLFVV